MNEEQSDQIKDPTYHGIPCTKLEELVFWIVSGLATTVIIIVGVSMFVYRHNIIDNMKHIFNIN